VSGAYTPELYGELLRTLLGRGYAAVDYEAAEPSARHLILRHDLDMSLQAAEPIAEAEAKLGVAAHYFVLLRTEMYNPFSAAARATLERLRGLGHAIGLHLDASLYGNDPAALEEAVARESRALEDAVGAPVRVVSFHRPAEALLSYGKTLAGRRHTYEPRFFREMGYCSDSRGGWHHGAPLDHSAVAQGRALQLLTHPIWWTGTPSEPVVRLGRFLEARRALLDSELARNCSIYRPAAKAGEGA
jgi:hypothetical protein